LDDLAMQGMLSTEAEKTLAVAIEDSSAAIVCGGENLENCKGLGPQLSASGEMVWGYIGTEDKTVSSLKLAGAENAIPSKELGLQYIRKIKGKRELVFRENSGDMQATLADEMTEALAAMPEDKRFALLVEYGSMVPFLEQADAERAANQFLDFDLGVKAALAYTRRVNSDDNPANDTLLVVASTADLGGVAGIGVTRRMHKLPSVRDDITSAKGKPDYEDEDSNGFPDTWDNAHRVVAGWISRVKHRDDRLPDPEFLPMKKRDPSGVVIGGNTYADTVQCILADVPVAAEGPGAEMFMGLTRNTELAGKIKKALGL